MSPRFERDIRRTKASARVWMAAALVVIAPLCMVQARAQASPPPGSGEWNFQVSLDGKPIGSHRFTVAAQHGDGATGFTGSVNGVADFTVRLLGIAVYRYRHESAATWKDGCIGDLKATTDDNGKTHRVVAQRRPDGLSVAASGDPAAATALQGCIMDYAYWSPSLRERSKLLNPQSGMLDEVRITSLGTKSINVSGAPVPAKGWRIEGPEKPVDVWYAESDGRWIGLDSQVDGGRTLSYRLP